VVGGSGGGGEEWSGGREAVVCDEVTLHTKTNGWGAYKGGMRASKKDHPKKISLKIHTHEKGFV